jgi:hypothetical protein
MILYYNHIGYFMQTYIYMYICISVLCPFIFNVFPACLGWLGSHSHCLRGSGEQAPAFPKVFQIPISNHSSANKFQQMQQRPSSKLQRSLPRTLVSIFWHWLWAVVQFFPKLAETPSRNIIFSLWRDHRDPQRGWFFEAGHWVVPSGLGKEKRATVLPSQIHGEVKISKGNVRGSAATSWVFLGRIDAKKTIGFRRISDVEVFNLGQCADMRHSLGCQISP